MIKSDIGQPLRDELANSAAKILASAFPNILPQREASVSKKSSSGSSGSSSVDGLRSPQFDCSNTPATTLVAISNAHFGGLCLIKTLVKLLPLWLKNNRVVFELLVNLWNSAARIERLQNDPELTLVQVSLMWFRQS